MVKLWNAVLLTFFLLSCLLFSASGDKLEDSIYKTIKYFKPCTKLLNATHQIGCTSSRKGNVGVVHYIDSEESFNWLLHEGKHDPYVPLFTAEYFTHDRLKRLKDAHKISGALVLHDNKTTPPSSGFSPEYPCPNQNFDICNANEQEHCCDAGDKNSSWNPSGSAMSYNYYDFPIFALYDQHEYDQLIECYRKHNKAMNNEKPDYPLCGVELRCFMYAAKDTPTCLRKGEIPSFSEHMFCDPLGDVNVWGTLFPLQNETNPEVVLATAKLDSSAFFHNFAFGSDNDGSGIAVLLAVADALGKHKRKGSIKPPESKKKKSISCFHFLTENWDYIGSSRMVYDMINGYFPRDVSSKFPKIGLSNILYYMELNQVGLSDENSLWAHSHPNQHKDASVKAMLNLLSKFGATVNLSIENPSANSSHPRPLPPSSLQSFLKENGGVPGVVITDHKAAYTNKFYNSRFDELDLFQSSVKNITNLATTVAKTLYKLAYNETKDDIEASEELVNRLLMCLYNTGDCSVFYDAVSTIHKASERRNIARYVGVFSDSGQVNLFSSLIKYLLSYLTGERLNQTKCEREVDYNIYKRSIKECVRASVYTSIAKSPAFDLHDYSSKYYSTWTESRWESCGMRMFLIGDPVHEAITLTCGIVVTLLSLVATVFMYMKAEQLFVSSDCVMVINDNMQS
ncbi:LOW QUALITY PROTEIN: nicastrin-like [Xenia sp. Carnegie-2017]|uniref:LOW QUALITY PROTEIN: nicastrin-like n=1 Tax=Xenia sp. Carnegie-2017 TaxID=2897299 RepID=UPI001F03EDB4|nr:LOW QUALITY PROTEIN: nicastrin-like [Xenia sp. Carnegie-2017]